VDRTRFFAAPVPLRLYALFSMVEEVLTDASEIPRRFFNTLLEADRGEAHKILARGYGLRLRIEGGRLFCEDDVVLSREKGYVLAVPQRREPSPHVMIHVSVTPSLGAERREHTVVLDSRGLHFPLVLRSWRRGDAIILPDGAKEVKTLLSESRVPTAWRNRVPVLEDRHGVVGIFVGPWTAEDILRADARGERGGFQENGAVIAELDLDEV
jgi:tRNA(Ile)-lysidine synthetase-like protein